MDDKRKEICNLATEIRNFAKLNKPGSPIKTNDARAIKCVESLSEFGAKMLELMGSGIPNDVDIKVAKGAANYPFIPWLAFLLPGQKVSNGVYIAVCFEKEGRGAVAGIAISASTPPETPHPTTEKRTPLKEGDFDVDSPSGHSTQAFNDTFINPKQFEISATDIDSFITHMTQSLNKYMSLMTNTNLQAFALRVGSGRDKDNPEVKSLLNGVKTITISRLANFVEKIQKNDIIYVVLGGDGMPWQNGLKAIAKVSKTPYDIGYDKTDSGKDYFKIDIDILLVIPESFKKEDLNIHQKYGSVFRKMTMIAGGHAANQAIVGVSDPVKAAESICAVVIEKFPEHKSDLMRIFPYAFSGVELSPFEIEIAKLIESFGQVILYGPPGTGKTRIARRLAEAISEEHDLVVFHPSYGYEDFVGGIRPTIHTPESGTPTLAFTERAGPFLLACEKAVHHKAKGNLFTLIIDEINRGEIARIFGEAIFAIELGKRDVDTTLAYTSSRKLSVPKNLRIIGTMNSSDRSIALIDVALRRRFAFVEIPPDHTVLSGTLIRDIHLDSIMVNLNNLLSISLGKDHLIGQAYFLNAQNDQPISTISDFRAIWNARIAPLLEEYFYGREEEMLEVVGKALVQETSIGQSKIQSVSASACRRFESDDAMHDALKSFTRSNAKIVAVTPKDSIEDPVLAE